MNKIFQEKSCFVYLPALEMMALEMGILNFLKELYKHTGGPKFKRRI